MAARTALALTALVAWLAVGAANAQAPKFNRPALRRDLNNPFRLTASYRLQRSSFPAGSMSVFLSGNDLGEGAGQVLFRNGISHPIYLYGHTIHDEYRSLGPGWFQVISPLGMAGGETNGHPTLWEPRAAPVVLSGVDGTVSAITLGSVVGVTEHNVKGFRSELWNYGTGSVYPLGAVRLGGMNATGDLIGQTGSFAWYAHVTPGNLTEHQTTWPGSFNSVNNWGIAVGYRTVNGGPKPVEYNLATGHEVDLPLPRGFRYLSLLGINDGNVAVGNAFRNALELRGGIATPVIYPGGPLHPIVAARLPVFGARGLRLSDLSAISDGGILFGSAARGLGEFGIRMPPLFLPDKMSILGHLLALEFFDPVISDHAFFHLENAYVAIEAGHRFAACDELDSADDVFESEYKQVRAGGDAAEIAYYDDIDATLYDLEDELGCNSDLPSHIFINPQLVYASLAP